MKKKKKKKKKNNNKGRPIKCIICLHQYTSQNLDKHMHGRSHHEAIERLKGGEQMHECWACDVSVLGLEQFRKHIETVEHKHKLLSLKKRRESGFTVDYSNDEMTALCAQRDRNRSMFKQQKSKEKLKKLKERMAANFQEAFNWRSRMKDRDWRTLGKGFGPPGSRSGWSDDKSVAYPVNNENKQGRINAEPGLGSISDERAQTIGWNNFCFQTSKPITWSLKEDVDFTSDLFAQSRKEEGESWQSQCTSREQGKDVLGQKRSRDAHTSDSPPVKKQCLRAVPSMKPRLTPSVCGEKVECVRTGQSASAPAPLCAPELVQSQMEHLCVMLKNIRKSLDEERLPVGPDPELRPATGDGSKRTEHGKETPLPDSPQYVEAGETRSSPRKQVNSLPASDADPQEKPGATQTRNVLPTLLSRSVSKTEANKPNLKVARGIRTAQKPSQAAESWVLKPALQKLISSKSSQWRINWEEIYQEATHRKLQREKGMPRFGIELVSPLPPDPQGLVAEDLAHLELDEGFQWASVECDAVTLPRSVSASSKDACSFPPAEAFPAERRDHGKTTETTNRTSWSVERERRDVGENRRTSGISRSAEFVADRLENRDLNDDSTSEDRALGRRQNLTPRDSLVCVKTEKSDNYCAELDKPDHDRIHSIPDHDRIHSIPDAQIKQEKQDFPNATTHIKNPPKSK
ncbi:hypothetical protein AMELA_G00281240 [Ameiurus melas]|uniref:Uncharacterized protein n=1 Tax=Ameiurus melas TaxID=219545 RepID=A0A7J5ZKB4_AMEME|nr:hypothetical protein AMELA_G00281240 [Ameiurus melas]